MPFDPDDSFSTMNCREPSMLAGHVVRRRRQRSERRPAQDEFNIAVAQQVGQVGVTAVKLLHARIARKVETRNATGGELVV